MHKATDQDIFEYAQIAGDPNCDLAKLSDEEREEALLLEAGSEPPEYANEKTQADFEKWNAIEQEHRDTVRASIEDSRAIMEKGSHRLRALVEGWK